MVDRIQGLLRAVQKEYAATKNIKTIKNKQQQEEMISDLCMEQLPEEVEEGNVEYKLQLLDPSSDRVNQLTTQMHWRLNEGKGTAFYEVGVQDNGDPVGITEEAMLKSITTLSRMCQVVNADMKIVRFRSGAQPYLKSARVQVTRILEKNAKKQVRVSVIGDFESGKSTLIGVLTRGSLDDGNGLARMQVFRHRHEIEDGRTSSISEHTIGITADGRFCSTAEYEDCDFREDEPSNGATKSFITLSDLAGHKKYLKVTASGFVGQFPDYAMLVVDSTKGVQSMTREHIKIATALEVAVFVVLTKTDVATEDRIQKSIKEVAELIQSFCSDKSIVPVSKSGNVVDLVSDRCIPVFRISNVNGHGLDILQEFLAALEPKRVWPSQNSVAAEFQINKAYVIEDVGTIVTGLMQSGTLSVGERMLLGPDGNGQFLDITVDNIEVQRKPAQYLCAGETGAVLITFPEMEEVSAFVIRKGMMLVHPSLCPMATRQFDAEVQFLTDSPPIRENYQAVIHAGQIRQMAKLIRMGSDHVKQCSTDKQPITRICRFEFMYWPEYMRPDLPLVLREGRAHAVGKVVRPVHFRNEQVSSVRTC